MLSTQHLCGHTITWFFGDFLQLTEFQHALYILFSAYWPTLSNIRNQVARPTSRASRASRPSQPANQAVGRPPGQPKTKPIQKHAGSQPAGRPAKTQAESGQPARRGSYTRLAGRPAELNTDWPAGWARNSRTSSPRSQNQHKPMNNANA